LSRTQPKEKVAYSNLTEMDKELPYQLVGAGCDFHQHPVDRPFGYPTHQWIQTYRGCGILTLEGREYRVPENHGFLLFPGESHEYREEEGGWFVHWITFGGNHANRMLRKLGIDASGVFRISDPSVPEERMREAYRLIDRGAALSGMDGSVLVYRLLFDLYRGIRSRGDRSHGDKALRLKPAFEHINENLRSTIAVEDLARIIGITPQHFCMLFKDVTGHRPVDYINSLRIKAAKDMLASDRDLPVGEVGRRVGFGNNSYFSTIFRRYEGISPRQYKDLH
jgi:AraC family transcriptional regulator, arabinose operon regulatory protein